MAGTSESERESIERSPLRVSPRSADCDLVHRASLCPGGRPSDLHLPGSRQPPYNGLQVRVPNSVSQVVPPCCCRHLTESLPLNDQHIFHTFFLHPIESPLCKMISWYLCKPCVAACLVFWPLSDGFPSTRRCKMAANLERDPKYPVALYYACIRTILWEEKPNQSCYSVSTFCTLHL